MTPDPQRKPRRVGPTEVASEACHALAALLLVVELDDYSTRIIKTAAAIAGRLSDGEDR